MAWYSLVTRMPCTKFPCGFRELWIFSSNFEPLIGHAYHGRPAQWTCPHVWFEFIAQEFPDQKEKSNEGYAHPRTHGTISDSIRTYSISPAGLLCKVQTSIPTDPVQSGLRRWVSRALRHMQHENGSGQRVLFRGASSGKNKGVLIH